MDAASWLLQEGRSTLETTSCGLDQASAQTLLLRHLWLEGAMRLSGAELQQLAWQADEEAAARHHSQGALPCRPGVESVESCLPTPGGVTLLWLALLTLPRRVQAMVRVLWECPFTFMPCVLKPCPALSCLGP